MGSIFKKSYTKHDPLTGERVSRKSSKWYVKYRDADGKLCVVPGFKDKSASDELRRKLEREAELVKVGLSDPYKENRLKPLVEQIQDFQKYLENQDRTENYVKTTVQRVQAVVTDGGIHRLADVTLSRVQAFLASLKQKGKSLATCNHYLTAFKMFLNWLRDDRRIPENPIRGMSKANVETDRRHRRRALTIAEFQQLIASTMNGKMRINISGPDRAMLYLTAAYTGLRRDEIASLTPASLDFENDPPILTLAATASKHRQADVIPLKRDFAELLREWISDKGLGPQSTLFAVKKQRTAEVIQADLKVAGIEFKDSTGRVLDFHSLRQTFITNLSRGNVSPKQAQLLARHSDINLTMGTYTTLALVEQKQAVECLPPLPRLQMREKKLAPQLAPAGDFSGQNGSSSDNDRQLEIESSEPEEVPKNREKHAVFRPLRPQMRETGLEPARVAPLDPKSSIVC